MHDNVILIGMPGAGKSSLGVVLAKMLGYHFLDCDLVIQETYGKKLPELIEERGIEGFLAAEASVLRSIDATRTVIATGGSAVYSDSAMEHLGSLGVVVYLQIGCEEMKRRLGDIAQRGVVFAGNAHASLDALYTERLPLYQRYANLALDVGQSSIRESAIELKGMLEGSGQLAGGLASSGAGTLRQWRSADRSFVLELQASFNLLDRHRHLRPSELLRLFSDAANADFANLGCTYESLQESGYYFIVTHANCRVRRHPRSEERLSLRTWPHKVKGMQVSRAFQLSDSLGSEVAAGELVYLIVDMKTQRPIRIRDFPVMEMYEVDRDFDQPLPKRQRIKYTEDMSQIARRRLRFSDLDANGHVNNTNYATFAFDALPKLLQQLAWDQLQVEFAAELHEGEEALIFANDVQAAYTTGELVKVAGVREDGASSFGCLFSFRR